MSEEIDYRSFMFGMLCGMVLIFLIAASPWSIASKAKEARDNCEKDIPRSHQCEITATPKEQSK